MAPGITLQMEKQIVSMREACRQIIVAFVITSDPDFGTLFGLVSLRAKACWNVFLAGKGP